MDRALASGHDKVPVAADKC